MKKIFLYTFAFVLMLFLIACVKFAEKQNSTNISVENTPKQTVTNQKIKTLEGQALKGAQFDAVDEQGRKLNFEIRNVELDPLDKEKEIYLYTVFYFDTSDSKWKNLCTPDAKNIAKAIPLSGFWDETGTHIESTNLITFGCTSGVTAKCVRLGYKPWKKFKGKSLRDFHQACTRMLRADYCGNGKSHTKKGTIVNIYDVLDIQKQANEKEMVFEAAWNPNGATCINRLRWFEKLSEIRNECPQKFNESVNKEGLCATEQKALKNWPNSLIFNNSLVRKPQNPSTK